MVRCGGGGGGGGRTSIGEWHRRYRFKVRTTDRVTSSVVVRIDFEIERRSS